MRCNSSSTEINTPAVAAAQVVKYKPGQRDLEIRFFCRNWRCESSNNSRFVPRIMISRLEKSFTAIEKRPRIRLTFSERDYSRIDI
jgi:hypothetical protein